MRPTRRAVLASTAGAALALAQQAENSPPITPNASDAVAEWIRRAAIPLSTPVAGNGFADMAPLKKIVGDARIVALGEATHGTREFFQLKHRMLEFLVTQMGFSIFSMETSMPDAYRVNDFVLKGEGDPAKLIHILSTREVRDMALWMREYNESGKGRVEFTGFDMQNPPPAIEIVRDFVAKTDVDYLPALERASEAVPYPPNPKAAEFKIAAVEWEKVVTHLASLRPRAGLEWAIQNARVVVQCMRARALRMTPDESMAVRDAAMAANVKWILDQSPGAKIVLWAHNLHVMTSKLPPVQGPVKGRPGDSMGAALREMYGDQMRVFGFAFNQGSFRAWSQNEGIRDFTVGPMPAGSLDATLAASGIPLFALDLRSAPNTGPVAEWLGAKHPTRNIPAGYSEEAAWSYTFEQVIPEKYDALFFVEKTTAARPNPKLE